MALTAPLVVAPVTPCSRSVRVQGQSAGATVEVFAVVRATGATRSVGKAIVSSTNELVQLSAGIQLEPGELLTASQRTEADFADHLPPDFGVEVSAAPELADLLGLFSAETMLECGTCLWVAGVWPGARVTLQQNAHPPLTAEAASDMVKFVLPSGRRLHVTDVLTATQSACGLAGTAVTLSAPVAQVRADWPASGPTIVGPLVKCQQCVSLSDVLPGAIVIVELDGTEHRACFGSRQGTFWLPRALKPGDTVLVHQEFQLCELRSKVTEAKAVDAPPPAPVMVAPICEGDRVVGVAGLYVNAIVEFAADDVTLCQGTAAEDDMSFGVPSLMGVQALKVRQSVCPAGSESWSDWSDPVPVRALGPQASPVIVGPLVEHGVALRVTRDPWPSPTLPEPLDKGSLVQVVSQRGVLGETWTNGDIFVDVPLWFALRRTDLVHLRTRRCGSLQDWPGETAVASAPDLVRPRVADPACDCGGSVLVHDIVPGAIVDVFRSRVSGGPALIGTARAGGPDVSVDVLPLKTADEIQARQRMGPTTSGLGAKALAPRVPKWGYVPNSAHRLCQLTQDTDPTGLPHPVATTPIGITGTDLGISVEHAGRMYLFFGDAREAPGIATNADPIAWLTMSDPDELETTAPDLGWVLGGDGKFRRLTLLYGPELGNFDVPTGAFSYDGRIHVFVAMKASDDPPMTQSRLVVADDPADDFATVLYISSTVGGQTLTFDPDGTPHPMPFPGNRWMLHISPTVVRNADWPGLPSSNGDGLLMFGSSVYRGGATSDLTPTEQTLGNVYLAWAPLVPGMVPPNAPIPPASDWQFFIGLDTSDNPIWGTLAGGATPVPILPSDSFGPRMLGEISVVWYPALRRWILAGGTLAAPINLAHLPWGPWTTSDVICDAGRPDRDAGNLKADGHWAGAGEITYAPYLIARWSKWDRSVRRTTAYFTLSVYDEPNDQVRYQPQLMRSTIDCWS
jgi:hypothetical protein